LLEDGLGDTVRVSLTEDPEFEIPVALALVQRYDDRRTSAAAGDEINSLAVNPFKFSPRESHALSIIGGRQVPVVIADFSKIVEFDKRTLRRVGHHYLPEQDKWVATDLAADLIYLGSNLPFEDLPGSLGQIYDYEAWKKMDPSSIQYPLFNIGNYKTSPTLNFLSLDTEYDTLPSDLSRNTALIINTSNQHAMPSIRRFISDLIVENITNPVIIHRDYASLEAERMQLYAATDIGGLLVDGLGDGVMLTYQNLSEANKTAFGTLQAARTRMTKTEYISCPSCGRTLFDLQETTAMIRARTDHLKGVKIGIMGCIVNGPGEMADADYGYVGSGPGKITLYKGQEVVRKGLPPAEAVEELINLIKEHGDWVEQEILIPKT
jgi:(E)-4-hydroxy-3-methylbut-2-enyl-diphosphate synthase